MHDCQTTTEKLLDLAFGAMQGPTQFALLHELQECDTCRSEYLSYKETLRTFDRAATAVPPPEIYWAGYQSKLRRSLRALEVKPDPPPVVPLWRRFLAGSINIPAPLAAAASLLLMAGGIWALRVANRPAVPLSTVATPAAPAPQPTPATIVITKQVEVPALPVVHERVVTRTVYLDRTPNARLARTGNAPAAPADPASHALNASEPAALAGFQTPSEVKLRVIKNDAREE